MLMNYIAKHSRDHASWFRMCITREVDRKGPSLLVTNKLTNIKTLGFVYQYIFLSYTMLCVHVRSEEFSRLGSTTWYEQRLLPVRLRYV